MRQIVFLLLCCFGFLAQVKAQEPTYSLLVKGVLYYRDGKAAANIPLRIRIDTIEGFSYGRAVSTNEFGEFSDKIAVPLNIRNGELGVYYGNCEGKLVSEYAEFRIERPELAFKLLYCGGPSEEKDCKVAIVPRTDSSGLVLYARSTGVAPFQYFWNTGDSTSFIRVAKAGDYCVRVLDAKGCGTFACFKFEGGEEETCKAEILQEAANTGRILWVKSTGVGPFTYRWNTGDSTQRILIARPGAYCVTVADARGCLARTCLTIGSWEDTLKCTAVIIPRGIPNGLELTAAGRGMAPYRFFWSTGDTTQSIQIRQRGKYCVRIIDAAGCVSSACYDNLPSNPEPVCQTVIWVDMEDGKLRLTARTEGKGNRRRISWSTGETTASIFPTTGGLFCVKVADEAGCISNACIGIAESMIPRPQNNNITGVVVAGANSPEQVLYGQVQLLRLGENGDFELVDSTLFGPESNGAKFGFRQVRPGKYLLRAVPSRRLPNFLPTYFPGVLLREEARIIEVPSADQLYFPIRLQMGRPGAGPGIISDAILEPQAPAGISGFILAPNPAADVVRVELTTDPATDTQLFLIGPGGQLLRSWQPTDRNVELDLSGLPAGLYGLRLQTGTKVETQRLVRQ